jgi:hypothetical protein
MTTPEEIFKPLFDEQSKRSGPQKIVPSPEARNITVQDVVECHEKFSNPPEARVDWEKEAEKVWDSACHCGCGDIQERIAKALSAAFEKGRGK